MNPQPVVIYNSRMEAAADEWYSTGGSGYVLWGGLFFILVVVIVSLLKECRK